MARKRSLIKVSERKKKKNLIKTHTYLNQVLTFRVRKVKLFTILEFIYASPLKIESNCMRARADGGLKITFRCNKTFPLMIWLCANTQFIRNFTIKFIYSSLSHSFFFFFFYQESIYTLDFTMFPQYCKRSSRGNKRKFLLFFFSTGNWTFGKNWYIFRCYIRLHNI